MPEPKLPGTSYEQICMAQAIKGGRRMGLTNHGKYASFLMDRAQPAMLRSRNSPLEALVAVKSNQHSQILAVGTGGHTQQTQSAQSDFGNGRAGPATLATFSMSFRQTERHADGGHDLWKVDAPRARVEEMSLHWGCLLHCACRLCRCHMLQK